MHQLGQTLLIILILLTVPFEILDITDMIFSNNQNTFVSLGKAVRTLQAWVQVLPPRTLLSCREHMWMVVLICKGCLRSLL